MLKNGIIILLVSLLSACGGSDSTDSTNPANTSGQTTELEGSWGYSCRFDSDFAVYSTLALTFTGNSYTSIGTDYLDAACTVVDETFSSNGTFVTGSTLTPASGGSAREIDITISTINGIAFPVTFYDIYQISGTTLYTGDDTVNEGLSTSTRPVALDFTLSFTRQ